MSIWKTNGEREREREEEEEDHRRHSPPPATPTTTTTGDQPMGISAKSQSKISSLLTPISHLAIPIKTLITDSEPKSIFNDLDEAPSTKPFGNRDPFAIENVEQFDQSRRVRRVARWMLIRFRCLLLASLWLLLAASAFFSALELEEFPMFVVVVLLLLVVVLLLNWRSSAPESYRRIGDPLNSYGSCSRARNAVRWKEKKVSTTQTKQ